MKRKFLPGFFTIIFLPGIIASLILFSSCSKKNNDALKGGITNSSPAKAQYDSSNYGIYVGIFVGFKTSDGSSGYIVVDVNNNNSNISATLEVHDSVYHFSTTQFIQQNQATNINFKDGSYSFIFTVNANGNNPVVSDMRIAGYSYTAVLLEKETSNNLVKCYEGAWSINDNSDHGISNFVVYNNLLNGLALSEVAFNTANLSGSISDNQIDGTVLNTSSTFSGIYNGNNMSGTLSGSSPNNGTWSATRTY